jgi:hypothetical protein
MSTLLPLNPEWIAPSVVWGLVALCRDSADGSLWLCLLHDESEGWQKIAAADAAIIEGFRWSQRLAGKEPQPWP